MMILVEYNNEFIELDTNILKLIGEGYESNVYSYKDIALKVYKTEEKKKRLSYEEVNKLKKIETQRILVPLNLLYECIDTNNCYYNGYTTQLIKNIKPKEELIHLDSNTLYNELILLKNDVKYITQNKVLLNDLCRKENIVFNGNIYFVDPGSYIFDDTLLESDIYTRNLKKIGKSLNKNLICYMDNLDYIKEELKKTKSIDMNNCDINILHVIKKIYEQDFENNINNKNYIQHLINILNKYKSLSNYKLNILKEYIYNINSEPIYVNALKKVLK